LKKLLLITKQNNALQQSYSRTIFILNHDNALLYLRHINYSCSLKVKTIVPKTL